MKTNKFKKGILIVLEDIKIYGKRLTALKKPRRDNTDLLLLGCGECGRLLRQGLRAHGKKEGGQE